MGIFYKEQREKHSSLIKGSSHKRKKESGVKK